MSLLLPLWLSFAAVAFAAPDPAALPLGDGKYAAAPVKGAIWPCHADKYYDPSHPSASSAGWWLHGSTWDSTEKPTVDGRLSWPIARLSVSFSTDGATRLVRGNGLPSTGPTGIWPIQATDGIRPFDGNPTPIMAQSLSLDLPRDPTPAQTPSCVELPIGIGLDGVLIFSALDSRGRDEPAHVMYDACGGMSEPHGMYHRYRPSRCMPHTSEPNALVGYALDGYGIFSPYDEQGRELSTADLDECHGRTSPILWDGKLVTMYHYVLTRDYPYSVGCFRGTPISITLGAPPAPDSRGTGDASAPKGGAQADCAAVRGWACDSDQPEAPVTVFAYLDGESSAAAGPRGTFLTWTSAHEDTPAAGAASCPAGKHGFSIPLPDSVRDGRPHALYLYAVDVDESGVASGSFPLLSGSPSSLTCAPAILDAGLRLRDGAQAVPIAAQPDGASPLKARGAGSEYDVMLVDPADVNATRALVNTPLGLKALRRL